MSTRANIIIKDEWDTLYFYRHTDGYPDGVKETLGKFCKAMNDGIIRRDAMQSAGWLIVLGHEEYKADHKDWMKDYPNEVDSMIKAFDWKVGTYEPTTDIHGDIEYLYVIDVEKETVVYDIITENFKDYAKVVIG